eukprot:3375325-Amphidinium_carterae.1
MVRAKRSDVVAQGRNASVVAEEKSHAQNRRELMEILRRHESAAAPALQHLRNLGYSTQSEVMEVAKSNAR